MKEERSADGSSRQKKRKQREKRGPVFCVCACVRALPAHNMVVGTRVRVRERERKKKARGAEMMMVVDRGGSLGEGAMSSLVWRLRLTLPGGCGVCGVRCATFNARLLRKITWYLLSLLFS